MRKLLVGLAMATLAAGAGAQTRSSFLDVTSTSGITLSNVGLTYTVTLGAAPTFLFGGTTYNIISVIGFYALSNDIDIIATGANFSAATGDWAWNPSNSGTGGIAGWKTNYAGGTGGIDPNGAQAYTFGSLDLSTVDQFGYHVVLDGLFPGTSGNTGSITVPEPASLVAIGAGLAVLFARRRKN